MARVWLVILCSLVWTGSVAEARSLRRPAFVAVTGSTTPPGGWVQFCRTMPEECATAGGHANLAATAQAGGRQRMSLLRHVNLAVNRSIEQVSDDDHYGVPEFWSYPVDGKGDCEDIVLEKKRRLIASGWPKETLLITVVRDLRGEGHAVLTVVTTRGDYILDNHTNAIRLWHQTGYRFIKRQSPGDVNHWQSLDNHVPAGPQMVSVSRP